MFAALWGSDEAEDRPQLPEKAIRKEVLEGPVPPQKRSPTGSRRVKQAFSRTASLLEAGLHDPEDSPKRRKPPKEVWEHDAEPPERPPTEASDRGASAPPSRLSDFVPLGRPLGSGAFGKVIKVVHKRSGETFALKTVRKDKVIEQKMCEHLEREVRIQLKLEHPNILRLHRYFEDESNVVLVLEYAKGGSLFAELKRRGCFEEPEGVVTWESVVRAIDYLHSHGIVHRDLKPENILLSGDGTVKLADFGWCAELKDQPRSTFCGTVDYLSPEMVNSEPHDHTVDLWALGVLLYELLANRSPFRASNQAQVLLRIMQVDLHFPEQISELARNLIGQLIVREKDARLPLKNALKHPLVVLHRNTGQRRASLAAEEGGVSGAAASALGKKLATWRKVRSGKRSPGGAVEPLGSGAVEPLGSEADGLMTTTSSYCLATSSRATESEVGSPSGATSPTCFRRPQAGPQFAPGTRSAGADPLSRTQPLRSVEPVDDVDEAPSCAAHAASCAAVESLRQPRRADEDARDSVAELITCRTVSSASTATFGKQTSVEASSSQPPSCDCGNVFLPDERFCRRCGQARAGVVPGGPRLPQRACEAKHPPIETTASTAVDSTADPGRPLAAAQSLDCWDGAADFGFEAGMGRMLSEAVWSRGARAPLGAPPAGAPPQAARAPASGSPSRGPLLPMDKRPSEAWCGLRGPLEETSATLPGTKTFALPEFVGLDAAVVAPASK